MKQIAGKLFQQSVNYEYQCFFFIVHPGSSLIFLFTSRVKSTKAWLLSEKDGIQIGKFRYTEVIRIIHYARFANAPLSNLEVHTFK